MPFVTYSLGVSRPLRFCACVELWESRRSGEQEAEAVPSLSELALLGGVGGKPCLDVREFTSFPTQTGLLYSSTSIPFRQKNFKSISTPVAKRGTRLLRRPRITYGYITKWMLPLIQRTCSDDVSSSKLIYLFRNFARVSKLVSLLVIYCPMLLELLSG